MPFSQKQQEYLNRATKRWNIKTGATRSGKTFLDQLAVIPKRIENTTGNGLIALIGNTINTLDRNVLEPMRDTWGSALVGNISTQKNTVKIFGKKCYVFGADKITQVSKIQGAGFEYCYGDEMTTWNEEVLNMLKSRLDKPNSLFDGTCNPAGPNHFVKKFIESDVDVFAQKYTIDDNPFLAPFFVEQLKKEYEGTVYYDRYILGLWKLAEGLVYPNFDPKKHLFRELPKELQLSPWLGRYYISIDYGTANPFSAGLWCIYGGKAYRIKEYYYSSRESGNHQMTDEEYYEEIERLAGDKVIQAIVVDPSAASFIECIHRHGKFSVRKANNSVLDGIRNVASMLNIDAIKIHESCEAIQKEVDEYAWDKKKGEDAVIKEHDHALDETRYFVKTIMCGDYKGYEWGMAA